MSNDQRRPVGKRTAPYEAGASASSPGGKLVLRYAGRPAGVTRLATLPREEERDPRALRQHSSSGTVQRNALEREDLCEYHRTHAHGSSLAHPLGIRRREKNRPKKLAFTSALDAKRLICPPTKPGGAGGLLFGAKPHGRLTEAAAPGPPATVAASDINARRRVLNSELAQQHAAAARLCQLYEC